MRNLLQISAFLITTILSAQFSRPAIEPSEMTLELESYAGSIYESKDYQKGSIIDTKSGTFDIRIRYDIFNDALEYKENGKSYQVIKTKTTHVRINDEYYYYCKFKDSRGLRRNGYYILVELNEQYRIYKKYDLKITEPKEMDPTTGSSTMGKIKQITTYYIEENNAIKELPISKKDFLASFTDKEEELKTYMKKEKIRLKKEEDLMKLVAKYNALKNSDSNPSRSLLSNRVQNN